ncbi:MAG: hypothetical protein ACMG6S_15900, partial [Byssovorax sp.]
MVAGLLEDRASAGEVLARRSPILFGEQEPGIAEVSIDLVKPKPAARRRREGLGDITARTGEITNMDVKRGASEEAESEILLVA